MAEESSLFDLSGRVVIVTGGGSGIGRHYSEALAAVGARLAIADIDEEGGQRTAALIAEQGGQAVAVRTDIAEEADAQRMAEVALEKFGRIDALINNASLMSTLARRPWHEIPLDEWDRVMAVNLRGMFCCCRAVFPQMRAQRSGRIVNISSGRVWEGTPNRLHYTTSKAGVIGFTRALARELGEFNISVNAVTPGLTLSDTQVATTAAGYASGQVEQRAFKRPQLPADLVGTVMFLVSDASAFITGQTINVDGGKMMH